MYSSIRERGNEGEHVIRGGACDKGEHVIRMSMYHPIAVVRSPEPGRDCGPNESSTRSSLVGRPLQAWQQSGHWYWQGYLPPAPITHTHTHNYSRH